MKMILTLLVAICVYRLSCAFYSGWTGHGQVGFNASVVVDCLMAVILLAILVFYSYQSTRKARTQWRRWLLRATILIAAWATTYVIMLMCLRPVINSGRYDYWRTHRSILESIALRQLERQQVDGYYQAPTNEVPELDYPVFVDIDSSNHFQAVVFSHYATAPRRRSGFIFLKDANSSALNTLNANSTPLTQLSTNWFRYGQYKTPP
jgi:hypothetical protein